MRKKAVQWTNELLIDTFQLQRHRRGLPLLDKWLAEDSTIEITDSEVKELEEIRLKLFDNAESWDEEDLKMKLLLIGHLVFTLCLLATRIAGAQEADGKYRFYCISVFCHVFYVPTFIHCSI